MCIRRMHFACFHSVANVCLLDSRAMTLVAMTYSSEFTLIPQSLALSYSSVAINRVKRLRFDCLGPRWALRMACAKRLVSE